MYNPNNGRDIFFFWISTLEKYNTFIGQRSQPSGKNFIL